MVAMKLLANQEIETGTDLRYERKICTYVFLLDS